MKILLIFYFDFLCCMKNLKSLGDENLKENYLENSLKYNNSLYIDSLDLF